MPGTPRDEAPIVQHSDTADDSLETGRVAQQQSVIQHVMPLALMVLVRHRGGAALELRKTGHGTDDHLG
jgi:hypothetical protein